MSTSQIRDGSPCSKFSCKGHYRVWTARKGKPENIGREFAKCDTCGDFVWLTAAAPKSIVSNPTTYRPTYQARSQAASRIDSSNAGGDFLSDKPAPVALPNEAPAGDWNARWVKFTPSTYQKAADDWWAEGEGNAGMDAKAGSGKTTSAAWFTRRFPRSDKTKVVAFAKANALDFQTKMPEWVEACTAHSSGLADIRRAFPKTQVEDRKSYMIIDSLKEAAVDKVKDKTQRNEIEKQYRDIAPTVVKLVGLCKNTLTPATPEGLDALCEHFDGINVNGEREMIYDLVSHVLDKSDDLLPQMVDFDDMINAPARGRVPVATCDRLIVDEAQDSNNAQREYYLRLAPKGRTMFIGDPDQAIFGFRGADVDAFDNLRKSFNATMLPLSICYRCPQSVIDLAKKIVPAIEARPNAPAGAIRNVTDGYFVEHVGVGDMVICRLNAPLVKPCFDLIRKGVKAIIKGREIGTGLINLLRRIARRADAHSMMEIVKALQDYADVEVAKLMIANKTNQATNLQDQIETLIALSEGCSNLTALEGRITEIFQDTNAAVTFSSAHKAKGLENERVWVLKPELMPFSKATKPWQVKQEMNLLYVAITRSLNELNFVGQTPAPVA